MLAFAAVLSLCACSTYRKNTFTFCYPRTEYLYDEPNGVIGSEQRNASGRTADVTYLLLLYLRGPASRDLTALFPKRTQILSVEQTGDYLQIRLADAATGMTDSEYSLACACLALTCMRSLDVTEISIVCDGKEITLREDTLLVYEDPFPATQDTAGQ